MIRLRPRDIPEVTDGETAARFLRWCVRVIGPGFHPDNLFKDYVEADGVTFTFHHLTAIRLQNTLDEACRHLIDPYGPCQPVQQGLLGVDTRVPGKCYVIAGSGGVFEPEGVYPHVYPTQGAAEREVRNVMEDLAEDEDDRARLLGFVDVVECSVEPDEEVRDGEVRLRIAGEGG